MHRSIAATAPNLDNIATAAAVVAIHRWAWAAVRELFDRCIRKHVEADLIDRLERLEAALTERATP